MRRFLLAFCAIIVCTFLSTTAFGQITVVNYAFNDAVAATPCNGGTSNAVAGVTATFSVSSGTGTTTCTTPAGIATTATAFATNSTAGTSVSITGFASGATGYEQIALTGLSSTYLNYKVYFQTQRSGTGPTTAVLNYSTDGGTTFTPVSPSIAVPTAFGATNIDLSSITALNGASSIIFRIALSGGTGAAGTFRLDNFQVQAQTPLDITTANALPNGTVSLGYSQQLASAGGVSPYTYALANSTSLPGGLSMDSAGLISGTPTTQGTYTFDVTVTDSNPLTFVNATDMKFFDPIRRLSPTAANTKTETFTITINAPTAAGSLVRGKLLTSTGRGLSNALVMLTNATTGEVRSVRSSAFGYFTFEDCPTGHFYILDVPSKKYRFNQTSFTLSGDLTDLVLTAQ